MYVLRIESDHEDLPTLADARLPHNGAGAEPRERSKRRIQRRVLRRTAPADSGTAGVARSTEFQHCGFVLLIEPRDILAMSSE